MISSSMASLASLLVLVISVVPAIATDYTVGDSSGWTNYGVNYNDWVSDKTFNVGDTLLFSCGFLHNVNEVTQSDYESCTSKSSIQSYSDSNTKITLDKPGTRYFICGTISHCTNGMKLAVTTVSDGQPPSTPDDSSPPSPSDGTPSESTTKKMPSTTGVSAAAVNNFNVANAVMAGVSLVGLALMS